MTNELEKMINEMIEDIDIDPNDIEDIKDFVDSFGDNDMNLLLNKIINKKVKQDIDILLLVVKLVRGKGTQTKEKQNDKRTIQTNTYQRCQGNGNC